MRDNWNLKYDWNLINSTWIRTERLDDYSSGITYIPDNYFKYQKCLSGITYQYVNTLHDIYAKNAMVGKTWCIYDMYNEFDIINNFMVNIDTVDVCSTSNLDLTQRYYNIDNAYLKTKHKVLLTNQSNKTENDLYNVDQKGYLIRSNYLSDSGNTFRYKAYIKLGDNKHNEYHLKDVGGVFPTSGYESEYMLGKTYIIKHFFNYNLNATDPVPKLIFTDYDVARHMNPLNYSLYTGFTFITNSEPYSIIIKYHDYEYIIKIVDNIDYFLYSGSITPINITGFTYSTLGGFTEEFSIKVSNDFCINAKKDDYVKITFSGNTNLQYYTFVRYVDCTNNYISLLNSIPLNIINDFFISGGTYTIRNLQYCLGDTDIQYVLNESYYSKYFDVTSSLYIQTKYYPYNHYFDYDDLQFQYSGSTINTSPSYKFITNNTYIKYKLYEHLNTINSSVFEGSYVFNSVIDSSLTDFTTGFTVLVTDAQSSEYLNIYPKGTYIKIIPTNLGDIYFFRKNTFVNLNNLYKTLIVDYVPNEYFVIETYKSNSALTITNIDTIYSLTGISDILYSVYKNYENDWYRERPNNIRKMICNAYSRIVENDSNITKYITAILTQDDKNKFVLELYNPESFNNNNELITLTYDPNLTYKPIELIEIGVDKHTKIPIPILNENLLITSSTGYSYDSFWFKIDAFSIISESLTFTFSFILISEYSTSLDINWGDGTSETINLWGWDITDPLGKEQPYSGDHEFLAGQSYTITFSGNLSSIYYLYVNGNNITETNILKIKNLQSLFLNDNLLTDLDISNLIYLNKLYLNKNKLLNTDKFFTTLNSNGLLYGNIDTGGTGNAVVTDLSLQDRINNLILKCWSLIYNT